MHLRFLQSPETSPDWLRRATLSYGTIREQAVNRVSLFRVVLVCALVNLVLPPVVLGQLLQNDSTTWDFCHGTPDVTPPFYNPKIMDSTDAQIRADTVESTLEGGHDLQGNVTLQRGKYWLEAEQATYDQIGGKVNATGGVRFGDTLLSTSGDSVQFDMDDETGEIKSGTFRLSHTHGRGRAESISIEGPGRSVLRNSAYTTCDEGQDDWYLNAYTLRIDQNTGFASASTVSLTLEGVPVLFLPYVTFPIDDRRKSGFLFPSFGSSGKSGVEIELPYYINLAPSFDATVIPRNMSRRGLLLDNEFRYLTDKSEGILAAGYLHNDKLQGGDRHHVRLEHLGRPARGWTTSVQAEHASDEFYFSDFGSSLSGASTAHLPQIFSADYAGREHQGRIRMESYQTIDADIPAADRPYRRLPQVMYQSRQRVLDRKVSADFGTEFVAFDRDGRITGQRFDLAPSTAVPINRAAGFVIPRLTLRHTLYSLSNTSAMSGNDLARTLPIINVDSGLFFERDLSIGKQPWLQTLEPRLFYLYVPYKNQDDIPLFDTSQPEFSASQLFRTNRFNGPDRIGDANQFTLALTTRLLEQESGRERLTASIGQILFLRDRDVTLESTSATVDARSRSDLVADVKAWITSEFNTRTEFIWNDLTDEIDRGSFRAQYKLGKKQIANASYRFNRNAILEQSDYSFIWPLSQRWHTFARWYYSHANDVPLESLGGVEYRSCCWALRFMHRRFFLADQDDFKESIMVQLELKGLASVGNPIENIMADSVPGFERPMRKPQ